MQSLEDLHGKAHAPVSEKTANTAAVELSRVALREQDRVDIQQRLARILDAAVHSQNTDVRNTANHVIETNRVAALCILGDALEDENNPLLNEVRAVQKVLDLEPFLIGEGEQILGGEPDPDTVTEWLCACSTVPLNNDQLRRLITDRFLPVFMDQQEAQLQQLRAPTENDFANGYTHFPIKAIGQILRLNPQGQLAERLKSLQQRWAERERDELLAVVMARSSRWEWLTNYDEARAFLVRQQRSVGQSMLRLERLGVDMFEARREIIARYLRFRIPVLS